jgi:hypothetical protein
MTSLPSREGLTSDLRAFIAEKGIVPDPDFIHWNSGVYAVLDCVFSSMAKYATTVLPMLQQRFPLREGMQDVSGLTFTAFMRDVETFREATRFADYARDVMCNRQQISGRTKVEVAYDVCHFFVQRGHDTRASLLALPVSKEVRGASGVLLRVELGSLEHMVLEEMIEQHAVRGIGPALGRYLLMCLGREEYVKPDTLLLRLMGHIGNWAPRPGHPGDIALIQDVVSSLAREMSTTPARLDNALWYYQSASASKHNPRTSVP